MSKYTTSTGLFLFSIKVPDRAMSERTVRGRILGALQRYGATVKRDFHETVATWQDPAKFEVKVKYAGGKTFLSVTTLSDKWRWLNEGTQVRWALMNRNFRPKTAPGRWQSGPGAGDPEPQWRGYSMGFPQPGIEPRDWSGQAAERHRDALREELRDAIRAGIQSSRGRP